MRGRVLIAALAPLFLAACEEPTAFENGGDVAIHFATAPGSGSGASFAIAGEEQIQVTGANGTLTITDVRLILDEFKLERAEGECEALEETSEDAEDAEDACEEFEAEPAFLDLPLGPGAVIAATQEVLPGSYTELKFEAKDIDFDDANDDEDDDEDSSAIVALGEAVRAEFPEWPSEASMVVVGTFAPVGGEAVPFTAFFEAEVKVEREFDPPLVIDDANRAVTVEVDPSAWFRTLDGNVIDLSAFDFATTGEVVEFEAKLEDGFSKIEFDD